MSGKKGRRSIMKKIAAILLSTILACSFMVGCGDEDDSSSKKADKNDSEVSTVDDSSEDSQDNDDSSEADESKPEDVSSDKGEPDSNKPDDDSNKPDDESSEPDDDSSKIDMSDFYADEEVIGKWQAMYVTSGDTTYTQDYDGVPVKVLRFVFNKDNTGTFYRPDTEIKFMWSMKDGVGFAIDTEDTSSQITLKIKDGELVATEEGTIVRFKKVDEFEKVELDDDKGKTEPNGELDTKYVGKWECSKIDINGTVTEGDKEIRDGLTLSQAMTFEFKADGTGESVSKIASSSEYKEQFQWRTKDGKLTIFIDGEEIPVEISGDELTVVTDASKISLRKAS